MLSSDVLPDRKKSIFIINALFRRTPYRRNHSLSESQQPPLILYSARLKMLLVLIASLAFVAAGVWMVSLGNVRGLIIGIISAAFFGLCGLVCLVMLIRPLRILVVNEEGIQQGGLWNLFVAWEEINAIRAIEGRFASLAVYVSDAGRETFTARYPRLVPRSASLLKSLVPLPQEFLPVLSISEMALPVSAHQVIAMLQTRYQRQIERYNIDVG